MGLMGHTKTPLFSILGNGDSLALFYFKIGQHQESIKTNWKTFTIFHNHHLIYLIFVSNGVLDRTFVTMDSEILVVLCSS